MVRMKCIWTILFTILVATTVQAWDQRGGAISANAGQMDYVCDPDKPRWDATFVLTAEAENCERLVLNVEEMSQDTTLQIYDGSSLDQSRTCGRIITSSSRVPDIPVQGSMATLVLRKQSCTYDEPKFSLSWSCQVNDTATYGPSFEAGTFVNYGQGMMTWSDLGHPKRHTTAIVADTQVCLKVVSAFGPPNNDYPCESSSLTVHQIGEDGCLTRIHVVCSQNSYFHSESILANLLVVAQFDPSYALQNSDSYQVHWMEGGCQQDCQTTGPPYSTTTTYNTPTITTTSSSVYPTTTVYTAKPTTTEYYTTSTASTETSTSYGATSPTASEITTKYTTTSPSTDTTPSTTTKYTTPSPTIEYTTTTTSTEYTTPTTTTEYTTPTTTTEYTTPTTTTEYTTPTTSTEYTTSTTTTEYTTPTTTTEYTTPTTSTEYTTSTTSTEYTTPTTSTEFTTPTTTTEYTTPTTTTEYTTSTTTTEYTTPTTSTEYTTSATSTEYTTPTTTTEYTTPTTTTEYTTPTTTTDYTTPTTTTEYTTPTTSTEYTTLPASTEYTTLTTSTEYPSSTSSEYTKSTASITKSTPTATTTIPTTTATATETPTITTTDCGGKLQLPKGYRGMIDYKSGTNYLNNERCAWLVDSTASVCTVTFEQQNFEGVYDGCVIVDYDKSKPDVECKKYTSADYSTPQEVSGLFIVSFTSDYSVTRLGFKIAINCSDEYQTPGSDDDYNVSTYHSNAPEGQLSYPDTGLNYPTMARFLSVVQSAPALPTRWFYYGEVYMEDHYDCVETLVLGTYPLANPCTRWHRLCGYYPQGYYPANSTTDSLVTWAWSDYSVEKPGFTFNWDLQSPLGELKPLPQDKPFYRNRVEQAYEVHKSLKV